MLAFDIAPVYVVLASCVRKMLTTIFLRLRMAQKSHTGFELLDGGRDEFIGFHRKPPTAKESPSAYG